jgi:GT2 family glycosyltransferase/glycosyltransferase involved in cell wall biosynthesis
VVSDAAARLQTQAPEPLVVVSEFPPPHGEWIPYHIHRSWEENRALIRSSLGDRPISEAIILMEPRAPYWRLRALAVSLAPLRFQIHDEFGHRSLWSRLKSRAPAYANHYLRYDGWLQKTYRRILRPSELRLPLLYQLSVARGQFLAASRPVKPAPRPTASRPPGVSVVIPSRSGRALLETCLPGLTDSDEIIVVDNGSDDGTAAWLADAYPSVIVEHNAEPLNFSAAMNRGIRRARYSHVCALNNDMVVEPGFLKALRAAFDQVPDLFCASAQIFFPHGQRREETGKTLVNLSPGPDEFPVRCDVPLEGEDLSYVLYGSGGCSLYDAPKLEALGGFDEIYKPAYVEDLDLGVRAWTCRWPTVYCAHARVLHQHRATTSRYYSETQLEFALGTNFFRFLARAVTDPNTFAGLWNQHALRLKLASHGAALRQSARVEIAPLIAGSQDFFQLVTGRVAVFPGRPRTGKPVILIASPYLPFPLSHGAAVRIYNLLRQAAPDFDQVLVTFVDEPQSVPRELLELCVEVVAVHRPGTHAPPSRGRPDTVEEFDTPEFHVALRQTIAKWRPTVVQLEFTQMALYAEDAGSARTILVEHDITYDLYAQMLARPETDSWETRRQHGLWVTFETGAWQRVSRVVTMSEKDRGVVWTSAGSHAVAIGNGVDLERFQPTSDPPDARRLLFIGAFRHRPNVLALEFFLNQVMPHLRDVTLHVIAGQDHARYWDLQHPNVEVEDFVSDVRPAYRRATVVIAPLVASAGTNVKIIEAMAMGKAIVSTEPGIHGLELARGSDVIVEESPAAFAAAIQRLIDHPEQRIALEQHARATAERVYGWGAMGEAQKRLYEELLKFRS